MALGRTLLFAAVLCSASVLPSAHAQEVEAAKPGANGLKFGAGRLHPFFDLEFRYDSAAGFFPEPGSTAEPELEPEIIGHFRPGLRFDVPGANTDVSLSGFVDYVWYTGWLTQGSDTASRLDGQADFAARFNRQGALGIELSDHFSRSDQTENVAVGVGVIALFNEVGLAVPVRPGGGALEITPGVKWAIEFFEPQASVVVPGCAGNPACDTGGVDQMDYQNFHFDLDGKWKFLPKTAFILDTGFDLRAYEAGTPNPSARLLNVSAGLSGLISPKLALLAKAGWSHDLGSSGAATVIGHAELSWLWSPTRTVKVGYLRQVNPVPSFGTYSDDRGYAEAKFFFGGRYTVRTGVAYDYLSFYSGANRHDSAVTLNLTPEVQITRWFVAALGYALSGRASNLDVESINFTRHEVFGRLTFTY